jgi:hypothetical protein
MSEQEFELYLKLLSRCLGLTAAQREQIADELRDHLQERLEELAHSGVPRDQAVLQAIDEFGDAAVLAGHFTTIAQLKRRRFLMRLSLGSVAALAAAMLIAFAFWPENRAVQGPPRVVAQEKAKPQTAASAKPLRAPIRTPQQMPAVPPLVTDHPLSSDVGQYPKIEAALEQRVDFAIDPEPLKDAIDFIATRYQIPIMLDTKTLEDASIDTSSEVKLAAPGLKLRQVLTLLLDELPHPLGFEMRDGVMAISTIEKIREHLVVVVYDCRDLVHIRSIAVSEPRPRGGTTGTRALFSSAPETASQAPPSTVASTKAPGPVTGKGESAKRLEKAQRTQDDLASRPAIPLIRVIQNAAEPNSWAENEGTITEFGGLLVVLQNPIVHEKIKRVLADIRRIKSEGAFSTLDKDRSNLLAIPPQGISPQSNSPQAGTAAGF